MRNPERVLNSLRIHSTNPKYKYERLYRILFNENLFHVAYENIHSNTGSMTEGSDGKNIDGMTLERIEQLIDSLKDESYQPHPARRVLIPKKNGKKRPLGIPAFDDRLVQEVIRNILEAIYEDQFEDTSHGFRKNRSCHTALVHTKRNFTGANWFIEGDIKSFFDNIQHDILVNILQERISDERFIRLIRKFLNAGYMEEWVFHKTYSGTPQGGIISPILANIYLDKLDKYMELLSTRFNTGEKRPVNPEHRLLVQKKDYYVKKLKSCMTDAKKDELVKVIKDIERMIVSTPASDYMDSRSKRLKYVRYADDFLIGITGSKEDAKVIKEEIRTFLQEELGLQLSEEKTLITNTEKSAMFLGYKVSVSRSNKTRRDKMGRLRRTWKYKVVLEMPKAIMKQKLLEYQVLEIKTHLGKEVWKPKSRSLYVIYDDLEILSRYNAEIRGLYNYYSIAMNSSLLHQFAYIMEYSMYKTFAHKYRTTVGKICEKHIRNDVFTVDYTVKSGKVKQCTFYNQGFRSKGPVTVSSFDRLPPTMGYNDRTSLIDRLKAQRCELCGETGDLAMHHIRKLKDLKGKSGWETLMIARKRKTLAVCLNCHQKIHNGTF